MYLYCLDSHFGFVRSCKIKTIKTEPILLEIFLTSFTVSLREVNFRPCAARTADRVRLWAVKKVMLERINRRDRGLMSVYGRCPLIEVWLYGQPRYE